MNQSVLTCTGLLLRMVIYEGMKITIFSQMSVSAFPTPLSIYLRAWLTTSLSNAPAPVGSGCSRMPRLAFWCWICTSWPRRLSTSTTLAASKCPWKCISAQLNAGKSKIYSFISLQLSFKGNVLSS